MAAASGVILSIGHSTLAYEDLLSLLRGAGATAVADLRTSPYSRHLPQFNRETLQVELINDGLTYVFLGKELGGRPAGSSFYCDGVADYEKMAATETFHQGLDRVIAGSNKYCIALMCTERHPLDCHRCLLVGRELLRRGVDTQHVLADGSIETQSQLEELLLENSGRKNDDLFASRNERLAMAYRERARKVAFEQPEPEGPMAAE
jgi:uncharacterized protein (DUF488 family)